MFSTLWNKVKEMINKMIGPRTIEQALHVKPVISNKMIDAIQTWTDLYEGNAPWLNEPSYANPAKVVSMGLPAFIASEKARMAVIEMKSEITVPTETVTSGNPEYVQPTLDEFGNMVSTGKPKMITEEKPVGVDTKANFLNDSYQRLLDRIRPQLEYGIAKGGLVIKPYIQWKNVQEQNADGTVRAGTEEKQPYFEFDFVQADAFFPLAFDSSGKVLEAAFVQSKVDKNNVYRRLEYHKLENNTVTIQNRVFKSENTTNVGYNINEETDLGMEVPLNSVPEWSSLQPETKIGNVDRVLFAYFRMPEANTVDPHSPLGVSGFSRAEKLIREADLQFSRLLWEMEGGELAIDIDRDAMNYMQDSEGNNHTVMGHLQQRLFRQIDLGESDTYQPYSPALRDSSLINALNTILMRIEDVCALSRGTISDVAAEARTATELKILKQRSYSANAEIQKALESTLKDVVYIMNIYCGLYDLVDDGEYEASFEWDDSILVDVDTELTKRITLMQNGLASKIETRMWYFGETEAQAIEALSKVREESHQNMEDNMMIQSELGNRIGEQE